MLVRMKIYIPCATGTIFLCLAVLLAYSSVDNSLSEEDRQYISKYLNGVKPLPENSEYTDELDFITSVQRSVLNIVSSNYPIPHGQEREPKESYKAKTGQCFDRSRAIEKILRYSGFEARHVSIYSTKETGSGIRSLITPGVPSHAVTEVLTKRGWLIVDSNEPFVSIDRKSQPISIQDMKLSAQGSGSIEWNREPQTEIYGAPFTFIYGLYSRHGRFYPPYNFVPDINYSEFVKNIF